MKFRKLVPLVVGLTSATAVAIGSVPAQAATSSATVSASSGTQAGWQALALTVIPDTCEQLKRQLASLAAQGRKSAGCTTPAAVSDSQPAATSSSLSTTSISTPSWCTPGYWWAFRDELCQGGLTTTLSWYDTSTGKLTGTAKFLITQDILLTKIGRTFAENFDLKVTSVSGTLPGATLNLAVKCGGTCSATSHLGLDPGSWTR
jgi:hypothetical protein